MNVDAVLGPGLASVVWLVLWPIGAAVGLGAGAAAMGERLGVRDTAWPMLVRMLGFATAVWLAWGPITEAWLSWAHGVWSSAPQVVDTPSEP